MSDRKTIQVPRYQKSNDHDTRDVTEIDYQKLVKRLKDQLDLAPDFVRALKRVDNQGWQEVINDVLGHAEKNPEILKLIRVTPGDQQGISIGDPNWAHIGVMIAISAFGAGYILGTICFELGPCDFVD
ncbi:hypothetical protein [Methylobacterium soli]|uniref:Uncharacterized protein n=1 Tax=Methylobacterium soli TaxID=553447 RepID=A0A6L3T462_9HYPH|nr:hypothetical protein [Methylobacterium soli]KAB1081714.1 hypothetical protein F6X53_01030 [Methylobacterium soli]